MRTLVLIPARAGSKSLPGKNKRTMAGEPLFVRAGRVAEALGLLPVVSTDDSEIVYEAGSLGWVDLRRPPALAQDDTPMLAVVHDVVLRTLKEHGFETIVLLQPTQPLRKPEHVRAALKLLEETGADSVVSVVEIPAHYSPDCAVRIEDERLMPFGAPPPCYMTTGDYSDEQFEELGSALRARQIDSMVARRQDCRPAYSRDGTVYAIKRETIEAGSLYGQHCVPLIIPRSESVNLDTEEDWQEAERRFKA